MTEPSAATLTPIFRQYGDERRLASIEDNILHNVGIGHDDVRLLYDACRAARHAQQQADDRIRELESLLVRVHGLVYRMRTHHDVRAADEAHGIIVSARSSGTWTWGPQAAERDASSAERP